MHIGGEEFAVKLASLSICLVENILFIDAKSGNVTSLSEVLQLFSSGISEV